MNFYRNPQNQQCVDVFVVTMSLDGQGWWNERTLHHVFSRCICKSPLWKNDTCSQRVVNPWGRDLVSNLEWFLCVTWSQNRGGLVCWWFLSWTMYPNIDSCEIPQLYQVQCLENMGNLVLPQQFFHHFPFVRRTGCSHRWHVVVLRTVCPLTLQDWFFLDGNGVSSWMSSTPWCWFFLECNDVS